MENYVGKVSAVAEYVDTAFPGTITLDIKIYVDFSKEEVPERSNQIERKANSFLDDWFTNVLETFELRNRMDGKTIEFRDDASYAEYLKEHGYWDTQNDSYAYTLGRMPII